MLPALTDERVGSRVVGRLASRLADDCVVVKDESMSPSGHALARAVAVLDQAPSVGTVFLADGNTREAVQRGHRWLRLAAAHGLGDVGRSCVVMRRTTFEAAGQQGLGTRSGELSLWLRAAALADVAHLAVPLRLVSPTSYQGPAVRVGEVTELHERAHAFRDLFDGFAPMSGQSRLRAAAYRSLTRSARGRAWIAAYEGDPVEASLCLHLARDVNRWRRQG